MKSISNTAGMTAKFAYDPFGDVQDLNITSTAGQVRHDQHFGDLIALRSQNAQSPSTSFISRQFPGPGMTISRRGSQGSWVFQFSEPRGTRFTVDANGNFLQDLNYTPYGTATSSGATVGSSTFTTDQWNDGDALEGFGLTKVGKRIYDPAIGRFLSRDPLAIPRTASTTNPYAFAMNDPVNLSDPSGMDPGDPTCSSAQLCISTSFGGDPISGTVAAIAMFAGWAATYRSATGLEPPMPVSSVEQIKAYSAMFDANLTTLQLTGRFGYQDPGFLATVGGKIGDVGAIVGGAAGFLGGAALCATYIGCALGGPMMLASADIAGAHAYSLVTGEPAQSVVGQLAGPKGQAIEEAGVAGFGLAYGVTSLRPTTASTDVGSSAPTAAPSGIRANAAKGDAWEQTVGDELKATYPEVGGEITVVTESGVRTRIDWMYRGEDTFGCIECKSSETAPFTKNQKLAFPEIARTGAVIVGKGKPGFPGGTVIPPTTIEVRRP